LNIAFLLLEIIAKLILDRIYRIIRIMKDPKTLAY